MRSWLALITSLQHTSASPTEFTHEMQHYQVEGQQKIWAKATCASNETVRCLGSGWSPRQEGPGIESDHVSRPAMHTAQQMQQRGLTEQSITDTCAAFDHNSHAAGHSALQFVIPSFGKNLWDMAAVIYLFHRSRAWTAARVHRSTTLALSLSDSVSISNNQGRGNDPQKQQHGSFFPSTRQACGSGTLSAPWKW